MRKTLNEHIEEAVYAHDMANYLHEKLGEIEKIHEVDLNIQKTKIGLNIRFKKPSDEICYKYGLMVLGDEALVFIMPDKSKELIDSFLEDLYLELEN